MAWIRQHNVVDDKCTHCGVTKPTDQNTCIARLIIEVAERPEPARRQYASESFDAIGERLAELRKERDEAIKAAGIE